jgi:hypothetical protein
VSEPCCHSMVSRRAGQAFRSWDPLRRVGIRLGLALADPWQEREASWAGRRLPFLTISGRRLLTSEAG